MQTDIVRAELERLFELDELTTVCRDLLGFDPSHVGGTLTKGSFARALTSYCIEHDAVEALCEVLLATKEDVDPRVRQVRVAGISAEPDPKSGDQFGEFRIAKPLGTGPLSVVYLARLGERDYRLKVLRPAASRDRRGLHRCLTLNRIIGRIPQPGLPRGVRTGQAEGFHYLAYEMVEGPTLGARTQWGGPMRFGDVRSLLAAALRVLRVLHARRLAHGNLHLDNVIVSRSGSGEPEVVLVDAGVDRLRGPTPLGGDNRALFATPGRPTAISPEQIQGQLADARSDIYSFGTIMYQLLCGRPPYSGSTLEIALAHLSATPEPLTKLSPRGWVSDDVEQLTLRMLAKNPDQRPQHAEEVLELMEALDRRDSPRSRPLVDDALLTERIEQFLREPLDEHQAAELEQLAEAGADASRVADGFNMAAEILEGPEANAAAKTALLLRAARLYESNQDSLSAAEHAYLAALKLSPDDELALAGLEDVRKRAGKYEDLVEMLLEKNERTTNLEERSENLRHIGYIYRDKLNDREQALVAFAQALIEQPERKTLAIELEQLVGSNDQAWEGVLSTLAEAAHDDALASDARQRLLLVLAQWYRSQLGRFDLATACLNEVLDLDPNNTTALTELSDIYRRSQQWRELGATLSRRAAAAPAPLARDLLTEAAEVLEHQLDDPGGARDLYARVLEKDPEHTRAGDGLTRLFERSADYAGLAKLLKRRAETKRGRERSKALCRLAELYGRHLDDNDAALAAYRSVLSEFPNHLEALQGVDELLGRLGRHRELLEVLEREVELAVTPRQQISLLGRIASIHEQEFFDHERAAAAYERVLELDRANQPAITALMRHYRALERWEPLSSLYEKLLHLETDSETRIKHALTWGRLLNDEIASPERATRAYELALEMDPGNEVALQALARLKEASADPLTALDAILLLADGANTPHAKATQLLRAAKLLQAAGDLDRAIEHYKQAADADPGNSACGAALRDAYVKRGDFSAALQLMQRELARTEGDRAKAELASAMARLAREHLHDDERAEAAAKQALACDPTDQGALTVLGDLAFEHGRFIEASRHYESLAVRSDSLSQAEAKRVLLRFVEALGRADKWSKALAPVDALTRLAAGDAETSEALAYLVLEHGDLDSAVERYRRLLETPERELPAARLALARYRYGLGLRRSGQPEAALGHFEQAYELRPELGEALTAQTDVHKELGNFQEAIRCLERQLDTADDAGRVTLLLEIGDIAHEQLEDRARASESYVKALEARPDDRRVLAKLMQLYSEEEEWDKLVNVVLKLANFVDDSAQKAKYLETAGVVTALQLGQPSVALDYYERAFSLNPSLKALDEALDLYRDRGDHTSIERLLRMRLEVASKRDDKQEMQVAFRRLAELYERELGDVDNAIDAYEAAHTLDRGNVELAVALSELYATDLTRYYDRAVGLHNAILEGDPQRKKSYRMLRRLYTEAKDADASWCLCQALDVMQVAEEDERRFYSRLRSEMAAPVQTALTDEDWLNSMLHPLVDPLLTSVFALIEPAVIEARGAALEDFGYQDEHRIELASHHSPISQSLHHAAGALGVVLPPTYENTNDPGGLSFLHTYEPSIVFGNAALNAEVPGQAAAFIAARHLSFLRPGLYLRQLIGSGTGLKSWLFAAIHLTAPQFPVAPEMEGPIAESLDALKRSLEPKVRDHLTRVVSKMLKVGAALDLKRWIAGVDLTADRAGFLLANDLKTATEIVAVSEESASAVNKQERYEALLLFSISPKYLALRRKLGIAISE